MARSEVTRIPNLPLGQIVNDNGMATDDELAFRQALITSLQSYMGNEGLVAPTQIEGSAPGTDYVTQIQNHQNAQGQYTCQLGTIIYSQHPTDYTQDKVVIAVRNSNDYPVSAPLFKTITLT